MGSGSNHSAICRVRRRELEPSLFRRQQVGVGYERYTDHERDEANQEYMFAALVDNGG